MKYSKTEAINIVKNCAKQYQEHLEGRTILLLYQNKKTQTINSVEFSFYDRNFLHLTGFKLNKQYFSSPSNDSLAILFYKKCLNGKLSPEDFNFAPDGTTQLKLAVLPKLLTPNLSARMVGNAISNRPKLYTEKLTGGEKGCMGFVMDKSINKYVPNTTLNEDIRECVEPVNRVIAVFRKNKDDTEYNEITYLAKKVNWLQLVFPFELEYLLELIHNNKN